VKKVQGLERSTLLWHREVTSDIGLWRDPPFAARSLNFFHTLLVVNVLYTVTVKAIWFVLSLEQAVAMGEVHRETSGPIVIGGCKFLLARILLLLRARICFQRKN